MYEKIDRDKVLDAIKRYGPLQPLEVRRKIGMGESTMIGAVLSELAYHKRVAITKLKRGSSPYYYDPDNLASLENAAHALGEKDKRTYDLLREKRIIDPQTVDPLTRVSLNNIPDFSKSFEYKDNQYYRYFLVSEEEAKEMLNSPQKNKTQEDSKPSEPVAQEVQKTTVQKTKESKESQPHASSQETKPSKSSTQESQSELRSEPEDEFYDIIKAYCKEKKILIQSAEVVRKNSELDIVLRVPSSIGRITYFAKAKSKKKSNDGDVASALLAAQMRRLPALYLTTGEVTKKAKEMVKKELKGVIIKEI